MRCPEHNKAVGGVDSSSHVATVYVKGKAADIEAEDSRSRFIILAALMRAGFTRIGVADSFIHVDLDEDKKPGVMWDYY